MIIMRDLNPNVGKGREVFEEIMGTEGRGSKKQRVRDCWTFLKGTA